MTIFIAIGPMFCEGFSYTTSVLSTPYCGALIKIFTNENHEN